MPSKNFKISIFIAFQNHKTIVGSVETQAESTTEYRIITEMSECTDIKASLFVPIRNQLQHFQSFST